ncbi:fumarylacetoacetate hydrolase family protein [Bacillus sp. FJAT-44742]|uniref:fumarylacetoacetate hydrolase family protein n=1 Tax=Bacillus sp. FJAT-44742 TaxID=2014005 RepID=UPI000C23E69C|nr:fumarylacetoacetate hydrolase family protein [Bacillus sp. FJAT-44742]
MKLIHYKRGNESRLACIKENKVIDLHGAYVSYLKDKGELRAGLLAEAEVPSKGVGFLQGGEKSMSLARKAVEYIENNASQEEKKEWVLSKEEVRIEAPVQNPSKIICVGHNYQEHIREMGRELPTHPVIFAKFANAIIGPEDDIPLKSITNKLDYEAEFSFVIGKRAKDVKEEDALDYVAGYTIVNDISARDLQMRTLQWLQGKGLDGSAPMGPWLITKDEVPDPDSLDISLKVNGEVRQQSNTKNLVFNVNRLVAFLSEIMTLEPGDVICTGTPGGVGVARDPQVFLQDGDVVTIDVGNIGTLENTVRQV